MATYARLPVTFERGEGAWLWDTDGRRYLDAVSGIAVCNLGHAHPAVRQALCEQAGELIHTSNLYGIQQQQRLGDLLTQLSGMQRVFFANSGAEANDGLIKTARRFGHARPSPDGTPRHEILTFNQSFHGRTLGSMSATAQTKIHEGFAPLLPGFRYLPFNDPDALRAAIRPETVAIMLEPVQGEGGVHVANIDFIRTVAEMCGEHDLLLFFDEVQCGVGRCGDPMAWHAIAPGLEPDGVSLAKGLGGGVPIGAFWVSDRVIDPKATALSSCMDAGSHGSTFGGNPLVCAAALAVLSEISEKNLDGNAKRQNARIHEAIGAWNLPAVTEIRGLGLLVGIGLDPECFQLDPGVHPSIAIVHRCMENGLLIPPAGPHTVRLLPPLNVIDEEVDKALDILHTAIQSLV
jgi:predicted acetylornithine/succinylornithine family transaminase